MDTEEPVTILQKDNNNVAQFIRIQEINITTLRLEVLIYIFFFSTKVSLLLLFPLQTYNIIIKKASPSNCTSDFCICLWASKLAISFFLESH